MIITENPTIISLCSKYGISFTNFQKNWNPLKTVLNSLFRKLSISRTLFYRLEKANCIDDWVIVFDSLMSRDFLEKIKKTYDGKRLIFWYWNDLRYSLPINQIPTGFEVWTYSEKDAENNLLRHNYQILPTFNPLFDKRSDGNYVFYVGRDRGRGERINEIDKVLNSYGIETDFHIVANRNHFIFHKRAFYSKPMSYDEVLSKVARSSAVLDYYDRNDMGLSLRPFEALLYNKKVITNNINVMNYDFYNKDQFFILGIDDITTIKSFLDFPLAQRNIDLEKYSFISWLKRFQVI